MSGVMTDHADLSLSSGSIRIRGVELYPGPLVAEWRRLLGTAQQQLGGISTGLGLIGSPGWVIGGAIVLGALESAMSSAKAKEGVRTLEMANQALNKVRQSGEMFELSRIKNIALPNPASWSGTSDGFKSVEMSKIAMLDRSKFLRENGLTKADVIGGVAQVATTVPYLALEEEFVTVECEQLGTLKLRWNSVETYKYVRSPPRRGHGT